MMFRMEPPIWYLKSTIGNISLIERFRKQREEHQLTREETLFRFWMDFFVEATKDNMTTDLRCAHSYGRGWDDVAIGGNNTRARFYSMRDDVIFGHY